MKYARLERERRFLLDQLPDVGGARVLDITDRYLDGTTLRLRRVVEDGHAVYKLGQKVPTDLGISVVEHTTMYLQEAEHALLCGLPGAELRKRRHLLDAWAVDVHVDGLLLAETEQDADPPFSFVREVTDEPAFTGAELARRARR